MTYRSKRLYIEAMRYTGDKQNVHDISEFCPKIQFCFEDVHYMDGIKERFISDVYVTSDDASIPPQTVRLGDYIVRFPKSQRPGQYEFCVLTKTAFDTLFRETSCLETKEVILSGKKSESE